MRPGGPQPVGKTQIIERLPAAQPGSVSGVGLQGSVANADALGRPRRKGPALRAAHTPDAVLCEKCHERGAICLSTTVIEDMVRSTDRSSGCFESFAPPEAQNFLAASKAARCQHCGGDPPAGGTSLFEMLTGGQQMSLMCLPCSQAFLRYTRQQLEHVPQDLSQQEQMAALRTLRDEAESQVTQWVSKRDSR